MDEWLTASPVARKQESVPAAFPHVDNRRFEMSIRRRGNRVYVVGLTRRLLNGSPYGITFDALGMTGMRM